MIPGGGSGLPPLPYTVAAQTRLVRYLGLGSYGLGVVNTHDP